MKKGRFLLAVLTIFIFISALLFVNTVSEKSKLERLLADSEITVRIGKVNYSVNQGKVIGQSSKNIVKALRLAAYYQWNKEDPLFTSPDLEIEKFQNSISQIKAQQEDLLSFIKRAAHVYPTDFLTTIIDAAQEHQKFMDFPSDSNARSLIEKQNRVAREYEKEAESLLKSVSGSKQGSPVFINVTTDTKTVIEDIKMIIKNAGELKKEINLREKCLKGLGDCKRPAFEFNKPIEKEFRYQIPQFIDKDIVFYYKPPGKKEILKGPYIALTPCYGWGKDFSYQVHYFYIDYFLGENNSPDQLIASDIQQATNIYFDKIRPDTKIAYKQKLLRMNIPYLLSSTTAPYKCSYFSHLAEILTLDKFLGENKPIFPKIASKIDYSKDFFKQAEKIEKSFFTRKYPSHEEAFQLSSFYGYAYRIMAERKDVSSNKEEFLKRKLEIERKLSNVNQLFDYVGQYSDELLAFERDEFKNNPELANNFLLPQFVSTVLYPFRSYYGLMYFPFTKSFWRLPQSPQYLKKIVVKGAVGFDGPYLDYQTAIKKYSASEAERWFVPRNELIDY